MRQFEIVVKSADGQTNLWFEVEARSPASALYLCAGDTEIAEGHWDERA